MASIEVSSDGLSSWLQLRDGLHNVYVTCADWDGSSLGLRISHNGTNAAATVLRDDIGGSEVVATENECYQISGPGYIGGNMSSYGGTPVTITAYPIRQPVAG